MTAYESSGAEGLPVGPEAAARPPRVAVVGGGITGLAAAQRLRERLGAEADILLIDQSGRLGGKLRTSDVGGIRLEAGAEAFLVRDPDGSPGPAVRLAEAVGLGDALRHPAPVPAALAVRGELLPIPRRTVMGVPADPADLGGVAEMALAADVDEGRPLLRPDQDVSVGELVRQRFGDQVVDVLVDPLLGGVYAGRADDLSLAATLPALAAACRSSGTLAAAVRSLLDRMGPPSGTGGQAAAPRPVFATIAGGMSRLVRAATDAARPRLLLGRPVRKLERTGAGWRLTTGSTRDAEVLDVDALVLAVPAAPAARLLGTVSPAAAAEIEELDYASVALVGLVLPGSVDLPDLSGFLVPASEGYAIKALTVFTKKWQHLDAGGHVLLRASVGRYGEGAVLRHTDDVLIALVHKELDALLPGGLPAPVAAAVFRWGGALPQYGPGHLDRVARARAALAEECVALAGESLALAGAAYDGVGIPACIRSGWIAADQVVDALKGWES